MEEGNQRIKLIKHSFWVSLDNLAFHFMRSYSVLLFVDGKALIVVFHGVLSGHIKLTLLLGFNLRK